MLVYILATGRPTDRLCVYYDNIPGPTTSVMATQTTHVARSPDNKGAFKQKLLQLVACVARKLLSRVPLSRSDVLINTMEETAFGDHILSFIVSDRARVRFPPPPFPSPHPWRPFAVLKAREGESSGTLTAAEKPGAFLTAAPCSGNKIGARVVRPSASVRVAATAVCDSAAHFRWLQKI